MNREFIPYDQALALKQLGFDEPCFGWFDGRYPSSMNKDYCKNSEGWLNTIHCAAPTFSQAFRWFRDNYGYDISIKKGTISSYKFEIQKLVYEGDDYFFNDFSFSTYEKAEVECLKKLIEIVKNK
jgi:hypothetical protein